jgi:hypothetical protein
MKLPFLFTRKTCSATPLLVTIMLLSIGGHLVLNTFTGIIRSCYSVKMHKPVRRVYTVLRRLRMKSLSAFFATYALLLLTRALQQIGKKDHT